MEEKRAIVVRRGDGQQYRSPLGDVIDVKVSEKQTHGAFSLHERLAPPRSRAAPHRHTRFVESFYVNEGSVTITVEDERIEASPGTYVLVPKGAVHGWANDGKKMSACSSCSRHRRNGDISTNWMH